MRARGVGEAEFGQHLLELVEQGADFLVLRRERAEGLGEEAEGDAWVGFRGQLLVHAFAELGEVQVVVGRGAQRLVGALAHDDDADAEAFGVFDHGGEVAVVRDEDQGRGRIGAGHQLHGVDRQAHVRRVLAGRVAALVDEIEFGPVLGGGSPATEPAVEVAIGAGGGNLRLADEAAQGREVLMGDVIGVDQHADALVGLGLGGLGRRGGGGVGLPAGRLGGATGGGLAGGASPGGGGGFLGLGSGHGGKGPYPCDESFAPTMRNAAAPPARRGIFGRQSLYYVWNFPT